MESFIPLKKVHGEVCKLPLYVYISLLLKVCDLELILYMRYQIKRLKKKFRGRHTGRKLPVQKAAE